MKRLFRPGGAIGLILGAILLHQAWHWLIERVEVPPGKFLVRTHLWGKPLPQGEILAPDETYRGIQKDVLPEGRYFLNPLFWTYEIHPILDVPAGNCAVLTRLYGAEIPAERIQRGELLVDLDPKNGELEYRGIVRQVLLPGRHRINPYAYAHQITPAVEIRADQVGVRTVKVGLDPRVLKLEPDQGDYVVPVGRPEGEYRGVQEKPVAAGTYYLNPFAEAVVPVDVRVHRVEFTDIDFPSRDGFTLRPQILVTYRVDPTKAPELFVTLTEQGGLFQGDNQGDLERNQILRKVVLPHIRGYVRIEGSKFDARDFIAAATAKPMAPIAGPNFNPRERLQQFLMEKVAPKTRHNGVIIESITLAAMDAPPELGQQIADRELARVIREKNADRIGQYKAEQELKATEELKGQEKEKVDAKTRLVEAETKALQRKAIEESRLKQELAAAQLRLDSAKKQAEALTAAGKAEAKVIELNNDAEVAGLRKAIQGFASAEQFAMYQMLLKLSPALSDVFASDGSDLGKLFASYFNPPANSGKSPPTSAANISPANEKKSGE